MLKKILITALTFISFLCIYKYASLNALSSSLMTNDYNNTRMYLGNYYVVDYNSLDIIDFRSASKTNRDITGTIYYSPNEPWVLESFDFTLVDANYDDRDFREGIIFYDNVLYISHVVSHGSGSMQFYSNECYEIDFNVYRGPIIIHFNDNDSYGESWNEIFTFPRLAYFDSNVITLNLYDYYSDITSYDIALYPYYVSYAMDYDLLSTNYYTESQYQAFGRENYNLGYSQGSNTNVSLVDVVSSVFDTPINYIFGTYDSEQQKRVGGLFNLVLPIGNEKIDFTGILTALITLSIILALLKLFL